MLDQGPELESSRTKGSGPFLHPCGNESSQEQPPQHPSPTHRLRAKPQGSTLCPAPLCCCWASKAECSRPPGSCQSPLHAPVSPPPSTSSQPCHPLLSSAYNAGSPPYPAARHVADTPGQDQATFIRRSTEGVTQPQRGDSRQTKDPQPEQSPCKPSCFIPPALPQL